MSIPNADLARLAVNTLKFLAVDGVETAHSGHPGLPMGAADFSFVLWSRYLRHNPADPHWPDRDRFVLSAGHGSMLIYSLLHLAGYDLSLEELKRFRQWGSKTPGHPEVHLTPGIEVTTGPLGQGFANGVGMALAAKMAEARYPGLYNHRIWGVVSDGDMMEGISHEAASYAGHVGLGNLTYIYDDNKITLDGNLDESMSEDVAKRFQAYGWRTLHIDGHNHSAIAEAFDAAVVEHDRPFLILARTHIGNGAPNKHDTHKVHGEPLGKEELEATKKAANWPLEPWFLIPDDVRALWKTRATELAAKHAEWKTHEKAWLAANADRATAYHKTSTHEVPANLREVLAAAAPTKPDATRSLAGAVEQKVAELVPSLVGGDADLGGSTKTTLLGSPKVLHGAFDGKNIRFGIREHAMGAIANGMALYGHFIPFTATFLTFSDYMRPAIRLAALSNLRVVHVFTHDSIFLGEDGPTHQSIEHVPSLRLIPNVDVWRPADGLECAIAWAAATSRTDGPSEIVLCRQKLPALPAAKADDVARGGYVLVAADNPEVTLIATGSEVGATFEAAKLLAPRRVRVVSMPCVEVFRRQDAAYKASVLPPGRRVSVEASRTNGWHEFVGIDGLAIGIDRFGASAPAEVLAEKYGLTPAAIAASVKAWL